MIKLVIEYDHIGSPWGDIDLATLLGSGVARSGGGINWTKRSDDHLSRTAMLSISRGYIPSRRSHEGFDSIMSETGRQGVAVAFAGTKRARDRRAEILNLLEAEDYMDVAQLAQLFSLSEASIRRDLALLEQDGLITRVRGGAVARRGPTTDDFFGAAVRTHQDEKRAIARVAAGLLGEQSVTFFYSGTTVAHVAANLSQSQQRLGTVVTNSEAVISEARTWPDSHVVSLGGLFLPEYMAFAGPQTLAALQHMRADTVVIGCCF